MYTTALALFAVATILFVAATLSVVRTHRFLSRGVSVFGTVSEQEGRDGAHLRVDYNLLSGEPRHLELSEDSRYAVDDRVLVIFASEQPHAARILAFRDLWRSPLRLGVVALLCALLGLLALRG